MLTPSYEPPIHPDLADLAAHLTQGNESLTVLAARRFAYRADLFLQRLTTTKARKLRLLEEFVLRAAHELDPVPSLTELAAVLALDPLFVRDTAHALAGVGALDLAAGPAPKLTEAGKLMYERGLAPEQPREINVYEVLDPVLGARCYSTAPPVSEELSPSILQLSSLMAIESPPVPAHLLPLEVVQALPELSALGLNLADPGQLGIGCDRVYGPNPVWRLVSLVVLYDLLEQRMIVQVRRGAQIDEPLSARLQAAFEAGDISLERVFDLNAEVMRAAVLTATSRRNEALEARLTRLRAKAPQAGHLSGAGEGETRQLRDAAIRPAFLAELSQARREIIIYSPWISGEVVDAEFLMLLQGRVNAGARVLIGYGIARSPEEEDRPVPNSVVERLRAIVTPEGWPAVQLAWLGESHAKETLVDRRVHLCGSMNWLSYRGDYLPRGETVYHVTAPDQVREAWDYHATRFRAHALAQFAESLVNGRAEAAHTAVATWCTLGEEFAAAEKLLDAGSRWPVETTAAAWRGFFGQLRQALRAGEHERVRGVAVGLAKLVEARSDQMLRQAFEVAVASVLPSQYTAAVGSVAAGTVSDVQGPGPERPTAKSYGAEAPLPQSNSSTGVDGSLSLCHGVGGAKSPPLVSRYRDDNLDSFDDDHEDYDWECPVCSYTGYINCETCGGSGEVSCEICKGIGGHRHPECNGIGFLPCSCRNGTEPCYCCDGDSGFRCSICDGRGRMNCLECGGTRQVDCYCDNGLTPCRCMDGTVWCPTCEGIGDFRCTACNPSNSRETTRKKPQSESAPPAIGYPFSEATRTASVERSASDADPSAPVQVCQLAKELNIPSEDLLDLCHELGIPVKNHLARIEPHEAEAVRTKVLAAESERPPAREVRRSAPVPYFAGSVAAPPPASGAGGNRAPRVEPSASASTADDVRTLRGHTSPINAVAFSPDGKMLVSASSDQTIKLWNRESGELVRTFQGHVSWVQHVGFSHDGRHLASASGEGTVIVWETATGRQVRSIRGLSCAFSPDGQFLAVARSNRTIELRDRDESREVVTLRGTTGAMGPLALSPDGSTLASAGTETTIRLWNVSSGREIACLRGHDKAVRGIAFSPNGERLASASADGTVRLWDVSSGEVLRIFRGHTDAVCAVAYSPDGAFVVSASNDHSVVVWDVGNFLAVRTFMGHSSWVRSVAYSPDGRHVASGSADKTVVLWKVPDS
jgi:DNA-binding beta-propeller fold protein YncE